MSHIKVDMLPAMHMNGFMTDGNVLVMICKHACYFETSLHASELMVFYGIRDCNGGIHLLNCILFVGVIHPSHINGYIRMGTELSRYALTFVMVCTQHSVAKPGHPDFSFRHIILTLS